MQWFDQGLRDRFFIIGDGRIDADFDQFVLRQRLVQQRDRRIADFVLPIWYLLSREFANPLR